MSEAYHYKVLKESMGTNAESDGRGVRLCSSESYIDAEGVGTPDNLYATRIFEFQSHVTTD